MAILLTCNFARHGEPGEPVDLLGVGELHGRDFTAYIELDEIELAEAEESGLTLEADGATRLLLIDFKPRSGYWIDQKLVWPLKGVPAGHWRLSLKIGDTEYSWRTISKGEW